MDCKVDGCERRGTRKKLCDLHYYRVRHWGYAGGPKPLREYHGMYGTPEYRAWSNILTRCYNTNRPDYPNYGGRGITVCGEWKTSFAAFYKHVGPRPSDKHSIDRINVNGNYDPGNVRWVTRDIQNRNQRPKKNITGFPGVAKQGNRYIARVSCNGVSTYLGAYDTPEEAAAVYEKHHTV